MTALIPMPTIESSAGQEERIGEAEVAAAAFLSRYQRRTLDAYRHDLRAFYQWAADEGLVILSATRPQVELYVRALEGRGLAATTIDRRLSTICGFYRFAHIDGRIASNPARYDHRLRPPPPESSTGMRRTSWSPPWRVDDLPAPRAVARQHDSQRLVAGSSALPGWYEVSQLPLVDHHQDGDDR